MSNKNPSTEQVSLSVNSSLNKNKGSAMSERLIKILKNNRRVVFDQGSFDNWCVYIVEENGDKKAPFDVEYFNDLKIISHKYDNNKVYNDFIKIYNLTDKNLKQQVLDLINSIVESYENEDKILIEQWFTVIYAGMIAEENKEFAILKKRIKRLGMYQVLILNYKPYVAANFSKGKKWRELDAIMKSLGF
jgi:hypothetical protein